MSNMPLVSIIIPCYNAERWVGEAIESCVNQTYRPLEIIIIDDGSADGSLGIIFIDDVPSRPHEMQNITTFFAGRYLYTSPSQRLIIAI